VRLLFVSRSLPFHRLGGMEVVAWDLARILRRHGHEVEILTTRCPSLAVQGVHEGVSIRTLPVLSGRYSPGWWRQTAHLYRSHYRSAVELIVGVGAGAFAMARARGDSAGEPPLVMQVHGTSWRELISKLSVPSPLSWAKAVKNAYGLLNDVAYRKFDRLISIGPKVDEALFELPTRWMLGGTPVSTIPNGIDEARFAFDPAARKSVRAELGIAPDVPVAISASRLHVQKGVRESLEGFARARQEGRSELRYIVAGDGPESESLRRHATALGVAAAVTFVGPIERESLPRLLSAADVFLFTSLRQEGLALGPLEAAASGMMSVLSEHLTLDGLAAVPVAPRDASAVARAITSALSSAPLPRRSLLPAVNSLDTTAAHYEAIFRELLDGRTAAAHDHTSGNLNASHG
jgi:glycosyltransferase involved in cell wall biosynthesis